MRKTSAVLLLSGTALLFSTVPADADVVRPRPLKCPRGHKKETDHRGSYCRPPLPRNCKPGHVPRVSRATPYCEAPPKEQCPVGSYWISRNPHDAWCQPSGQCSGDCGKGQTCRESSLCIEEVRHGRRRWTTRVRGECRTDRDCSGLAKCVKAKRCDLDNKRGGPRTPRSWPPEPVPVGEVEPEPTAEPDPGPPIAAEPRLARKDPPPSGTDTKQPTGGCASCRGAFQESAGAPLWFPLLLIAGAVIVRLRE